MRISRDARGAAECEHRDGRPPQYAFIYFAHYQSSLSRFAALRVHFALSVQNSIGYGGIFPLACRSGSPGVAFSHTSSIERLRERPWWRMSAGIAATSPAFISTFARGEPVSLSSISHSISSESCTNHSTRSLPCLIGSRYSSVVGQHRLRPHTEDTEGFHVTSERDRYANRLKACTSLSNPGSACTCGSSCGTSAKARFTG